MSKEVRRVLSALAGALALALGLGGCPAEAEDDLIPLSLRGGAGDWSYDSAAGVYTVTSGADVTITGNATTDRIVVNGRATVTLVNVSIDLSAADGSPLDLADGADVTLLLSGTNVLKGGGGSPGLHVPSGSAVKIDSVESSGAGTAASSHDESGSLAATGGDYYGAGIGGGDYGSGGDISITGGTITATGGNSGAGIGGGYLGDGGTISIAGGSVTAAGGLYGAGIGGGLFGGAGGTISITGGTIHAAGGDGGAGIGGSMMGDGGTISITGGHVEAAGGIWGASGIGGGAWDIRWSAGTSGGTITINYPDGDSTGTAAGVWIWGGTAIGPGNNGSGGSFNGVEDDWPEGETYTW